MKIVNQAFIHLILVGLIVSTSISESFGQVITRVLTSEDKIENYIPWYNPNEEVPIENAPFVDVEEVLLEDQQTGREMPRIGIKKEVNYTMENGRLIEKENYSVWGMTLKSANAKSMSVRFDNTNLPENAIMYLFNEESRFIVGPVKKEDFRNGTFRSDYLNGDQVSVQVFIPRNEPSEELSIYISSYDHGILSFDNDFESSGECQINASCESGMECQIESVCKIIHSSIGSCSGALINNDCCDLTPYILTAEHCTAGSPVDDFLFRFNYQSHQCTPNVEPAPGQWIVYFGSELRAEWDRFAGTDMALLELFQDVGNQQDISYAGWDRNDINSGSTTGIHHPSGDVKKISYDNDPNAINGNFHTVIFDQGIVEPGSSGSPLFDDNNRIIGQLCCGSRQGCEDQNASFNYGRMDESWEGNGTPDSRLRDWLGASTNPNTMDCMDHPFVTGPDVLCTAPRTFSLINNMPCVKDVQWEVNPSNLFASQTNGNGNSASLWSKPNAKGSATITFTLTSIGCNPIVLEKEFWVGIPNFDLFYNGPEQPCFGDIIKVFAFPIPNTQPLNIIDWEVTGCGQILSVLDGQNSVIIEAVNCVGWMQVCATGHNECGTQITCTNIYITHDCNGDGPANPQSSNQTEYSEDFEINIFPNPANEYIEVFCPGYKQGSIIKASLISIDGRVIKTIEPHSNSFKVDVSKLRSGLYILKLNLDGKILHKKIVKL